MPVHAKRPSLLHSKSERGDNMNIDEAAAILWEMRETALDGEMAIQAVLFGIEYCEQLEKINLRDLSSRVGKTRRTCAVELRYGMQLSKYVTVKNR